MVYGSQRKRNIRVLHTTEDLSLFGHRRWGHGKICLCRPAKSERIMNSPLRIAWLGAFDKTFQRGR
jgi:hypothetical protein